MINSTNPTNPTTTQTTTQTTGDTSTFATDITNVALQIINFGLEAGARLLGYQKIGDNQQQQTSQAQAAVSGFVQSANQSAASAVTQISNRITSPEVKGDIIRAMGYLVQAIKDVLDGMYKKLNDPSLVQKLASTADLLDALKPALFEFIDRMGDIVQKMGTKVAESTVSIALNTAEAVPGVGAAIGLVRDVDKAAIAAEAIVEAGMGTAATFADGYTKAKQALAEKMQQAKDISGRIKNSTDLFNEADKFIPLSQTIQSTKDNINKTMGMNATGMASTAANIGMGAARLGLPVAKMAAPVVSWGAKRAINNAMGQFQQAQIQQPQIQQPQQITGSSGGKPSRKFRRAKKKRSSRKLHCRRSTRIHLG
jgi:hypothetical protein